MPLVDNQIALLAADGMIAPFAPQQVQQVAGLSMISFGLSSTGYDIRLAKLRLFHPGLINPKKIKPEMLYDAELHEDDEGGEFYIIPAGQVALGETVEYFNMPDDVMGELFCKSTYVRATMYSPPTIIEAGWSGTLTLELVAASVINSVCVYKGEGIGQIIFHQSDEPPAYTYATRAGGPGKYQGQTGVTLPKV